ncbi:MAG: hypothetical protein KDD33_10585 [Bdellovibrionales bacterium]|nr:hypothetical protein [Bdellovibrionales bacterium]
MEIEQQQKNLLKGLKAFGLNPSEWTLEKGLWSDQQPQILKYKWDQNFRLIGFLKIRNRNPSWQDLQILSL